MTTICLRDLKIIVPNIYGRTYGEQIPLQQTASDGLGSSHYVPMRPKIKLHPVYDGQNNFPDEKYVVIASQSTQ